MAHLLFVTLGTFLVIFFPVSLFLLFLLFLPFLVLLTLLLLLGRGVGRRIPFWGPSYILLGLMP